MHRLQSQNRDTYGGHLEQKVKGPRIVWKSRYYSLFHTKLAAEAPQRSWREKQNYAKIKANRKSRLAGGLSARTARMRKVRISVFWC